MVAVVPRFPYRVAAQTEFRRPNVVPISFRVRDNYNFSLDVSPAVGRGSLSLLHLPAAIK